VTYHGTEDDVAHALDQVVRVLRAGGFFQTTMLSKRNHEYGKGVEIAPNCFVQPGGREDKAHPHVYSDEGDALRLHRRFRLVTAVEREQARAGSWHWHLLFTVPA
jgi:tellurite methyltransferase